MTRTLARTLLAASLLLAACGDDDPAPGADAGADTGADATADAGADASDTGTDAADAAPDARTDATPDATPDTAPDASVAAGTCADPLLIDTTGAPPWRIAGDTFPAPAELFGSCSEEPAPEVVYAFTAPTAGRWVAELSGADPVIYVRTSCDDEASELACNDDADEATLDARVTFELAAGDTVFVVADTYDFAESGPFELTISERAPSVVPFDDGLWASRGYSLGAIVDGDAVTVVEVGEVSCVPTLDGPLDVLDEIVAEYDAIDADTIAVRLRGGFGRIVFDRVDALPSGCAELELTPLPGDEGWERDPAFVVEVAWQALQRDYAFFELRDLDWGAIGDAARARVSADTTDEELEQILLDMLGTTMDGHVSLQTPNVSFEAKEFEAIRRLRPAFEAQSDVDDFDEYVDLALQTYIGNLVDRLDAVVDQDPGRWLAGTLPGDVTYLALFDFAYGEGTLGLLADQLLPLVEGSSALVIDVRINGGGNDTAALELAARFADERRLAFLKRARDGEGFTDTVEVYIELADDVVVVPTYVLATESTVSAGEIFVMAMGELPQVTIVGEPTSGEHSDILSRTLPNGWALGLSNEEYRTADGSLYEMLGLPPDVALGFDMLDPADIFAGADPTLDHLLDVILGG